jgi:hypothetical protein
VAGLIAVARPVPVRAQSPEAQMAAFEAKIAADPENLFLAADYRQTAIAAGQFDRSIDFLKRLARRKGSGPNIQLSLAMAYIDKVPTSGDIRRLYLGRDAGTAATKAIEQQPTVLAYYIRGKVQLFFNRFIFKRIVPGIADLNKALELITPDTPILLAAGVYSGIGDGYWKLEERQKAREIWARGHARYPSVEELKARATEGDSVVDSLVFDALYASTRVDTSLRQIRPQQ